ncbi:hypothetical protein DPEC_G00281440 [Dallia pectoralis]|uniref:Uncharacterized protein n=1 Tax=Dallia pectoralis TaxID=75939 RepID=A0ACC2FMT0_DALPE|nr:hypothetical protein DPEC_G00281440 [Dallia pectoralis]
MIASLGKAMNQVPVQRQETRIPEPVVPAAVSLPESPPPAARAVLLHLPREYDGAAGGRYQVGQSAIAARGSSSLGPFVEPGPAAAQCLWKQAGGGHLLWQTVLLVR